MTTEIILHECGHVVRYEMPDAPEAVHQARCYALRHAPCERCRQTIAEMAHATATPMPLPRPRHATRRSRRRLGDAAKARIMLGAASCAAVLAVILIVAR